MTLIHCVPLGTIMFRAIHTGVLGYLTSEMHHQSASRLLGLSQTFRRSLGSGCLEQHPCCCS